MIEVAGKYRLHLRLGQGGMGEVWSATNRFTEKDIAIKLLNRDIAEKEPESKQRFLNEAKVSARVAHPNIVEVIDVGQTDDGQLFLVMELLTGVTLDTALKRQNPRLTRSELMLVMIDVASALAAAHASGIVHRDLKPGNIFLHKTKSGVRPTVLDFGVCKFLGPKDQDPSITLAGTVLGSPLYMSPEQARGDLEIDGRADIFAFGGILFEALTGKRAFDASNFNALIVKIATGRPKSIDEHAPELPASLRAVVRACLEPDAKKRISSFGEVEKRLRAALPDIQKSNARLPLGEVPDALFDPDATNALPVFSESASTVYEAALPRRPREAATPSPWLVVATGAVVIAGLAIFAQRAPASVPVVAAAASAAPVTELVVASSPSPCALSIDGADRGSTPATLRDVLAGPHDIACRPVTGPARTAKVTVVTGASTRYRFLFE